MTGERVIERVTVDEHGEFTCLCGNEAYLDGFQPVNEWLEEVDPDGVNWTAMLYRCGTCGRIIDGNPGTDVYGAVVGRMSR